MSTTAKDLDRLEADYRVKVAKIRSDESLSWEAKERQVRELGLKFDKDRKQLQEDAA